MSQTDGDEMPICCAASSRERPARSRNSRKRDSGDMAWSATNAPISAILSSALESRHVDEVNDLDGSICVSHGDGPSSGHQPAKVRMSDLEPALVGKKKRERPAGCLVLGDLELLERHTLKECLEKT